MLFDITIFGGSKPELFEIQLALPITLFTGLERRSFGDEAISLSPHLQVLSSSTVI